MDSAGQSRRRFLTVVAVGGAATLAGVVAGEPARALPPGDDPCNYRPDWLDVGPMTLGGIMITYVSAPLNARGTVSWTMTNSRSETISMIVENSASLSYDPGTIGITKTLNWGFGATVTRSTKVTNANSIGYSETQTITTSGRPENDMYATPDDTAFLCVASPRVFVKEQYDVCFEPTGRLKFGITDGGTLVPRSVRLLRDDPATRSFLGPETCDSFLAKYPLLNGVTSGAQLGLGQPRYDPPISIAPGDIPFTVSRSMTTTNVHRVEESIVNETRIKIGIGPIGFGSTVKVTHTSVQEQTNATAITCSGTLTSTRNRLNWLLPDKVFKTFLITDEGPIGGLALLVSGTVTDPDGAPIAGAFVEVAAEDGAIHQVLTDKSGRYEVRSATGAEPGRYQVACAGSTRTATVTATGRPVSLDYSGLHPAPARRAPR